MFEASAILLCYEHNFSTFDSFKVAFEQAAVWPNRFSAVEDWLITEVSDGTAYARLYSLDDFGFLVQFFPGNPGPLVILINNLDDASQTQSDVLEDFATPYTLLGRLDALNNSESMISSLNDYEVTGRPCSNSDSICTSSIVGLSSTDAINNLGLSDIGWRVQRYGAGSLHSTLIPGNLIVAITESVRGVTVTIGYLESMSDSGAPIIEAP